MFTAVFAAENNETTDRAIDEETESQLVELKEDVANSVEDYQEKYGSDVYGTVAYILNLVRIYSIPLCFLGIAIGAIHQYVIGVRKLDTLEKAHTHRKKKSDRAFRRRCRRYWRKAMLM